MEKTAFVSFRGQTLLQKKFCALRTGGRFCCFWAESWRWSGFFEEKEKTEKMPPSKCCKNKEKNL
jgi:hypothetical protein